jgi:hypothetical protein
MKDIILLIINKLHIIVLNALVVIVIPFIIMFALSKRWVFEVFGKKVSINE